MLPQAENELLDETTGRNEALEFLKNACAWFSPVSLETEMKCPFCSSHTADAWQKFAVTTKADGKPLNEPLDSIHMSIGMNRQLFVKLLWLQCQNSQCRQIIVLVRRNEYDRTKVPAGDVEIMSPMWFAVPQKRSPRSIAAEVPEPYRTDYIEAATILEASPRMSAVLSRRILTDLLAEYANLKGYKLSKQTEKVAADATYPTRLRENVEHFREIADFGAHTQKDETGAIIDVTLEEAEWTLELLDGFFDYFIVAQELNKKRREDFDKKIAAAGRKPIDKSS